MISRSAGLFGSSDRRAMLLLQRYDQFFNLRDLMGRRNQQTPLTRGVWLAHNLLLYGRLRIIQATKRNGEALVRPWLVAESDDDVLRRRLGPTLRLHPQKLAILPVVVTVR